MKTDNLNQGNVFEDFKEQSIKGSNKFDHDLYHEEDDIAEKVIRVKRVSMAKEEKWKIIFDGKVLFIIDGSKVSKKERNYLKTVDGFNFILQEAKTGIKSFGKSGQNLAWTKLKTGGFPTRSLHYYVFSGGANGYFSNWRAAQPANQIFNGEAITQVVPTPEGIQSRDAIIARDAAALAAWVRSQP